MFCILLQTSKHFMTGGAEGEKEPTGKLSNFTTYRYPTCINCSYESGHTGT